MGLAHACPNIVSNKVYYKIIFKKNVKQSTNIFILSQLEHLLGGLQQSDQDSSPLVQHPPLQ